MSNIILGGFIAAGKTSVGRIVAGQLGLKFVDTDALLTEELGIEPSVFVVSQGINAFREAETELCQRLAADKRQVIATGGGTLLSAQSRAAFMSDDNLLVVFLLDFEEAWRRLTTDPRKPLARRSFWRGTTEKTQQHLSVLYEARQGVYTALPHQLEVGGRSQEAVAEAVVALWREQQSS